MKRGGLSGAVLAAALVAALLALGRSREPPRSQKAAPETPPEPAPAAPPHPEPERGARIAGRVTDEEGRPVPASVWLWKGRGPGEGEVVARAGGGGRYAVHFPEGVEAEWFLGATAPGHAPSELRSVRPAPELEIDFTLRRGGGTLTISCAADAFVHVQPMFPGAGWSRSLEVRGGSTAVVEGLAPEWHVLRVRAKGHAPRLELARLPPEGAVDLRVERGPGAVVLGTVRTADGAPVPGAVVTVGGWAWADLAAVADEAGAYRLEHAPAALVELRAAAAVDGEGEPVGPEAFAFARLREGEEHRWDPVLAPPADIVGRVVDAGGAPVPHARVAHHPRGSWPSNGVDETDASGGFRLVGFRNTEYLVVVWPPGSGAAPAVEATATPGGPALTVTLPPADGFLRGVVSTRTSAPAAGTLVRVWPSGRPEYEARAAAEPDGTFHVGPLPAGRYFLELHLDGEPTLHLDGVEVASGETRDLGALRFPFGGRVRVRVLDRNGASLGGARVTSLDGSVTYVVAADGDAEVSEELAPGRYLAGSSLPGLLEEVEVTAGRTVAVDLRLRGDASLEVVALQEDGGRIVASFRVVDDRGRFVAAEGESPSALFQLASGTYDVSATDARDRRASGRVVVPEADGGELRLVLVLGSAR